MNKKIQYCISLATQTSRFIGPKQSYISVPETTSDEAREMVLDIISVEKGIRPLMSNWAYPVSNNNSLPYDRNSLLWLLLKYPTCWQHEAIDHMWSVCLLLTWALYLFRQGKYLSTQLLGGLPVNRAYVKQFCVLSCQSLTAGVHIRLYSIVFCNLEPVLICYHCAVCQTSKNHCTGIISA